MKAEQSLTNEDAGQAAKMFVEHHGAEIWRKLKPKVNVGSGFESYVKGVLLMGVEIGVAETLKIIRDAADKA